MPKPPSLNPTGIVPSRDKAFKCYISDPERILFTCAPVAIPIEEADLDGGFAFTAKETSDIILWIREIKRWGEQNCKGVR